MYYNHNEKQGCFNIFKKLNKMLIPEFCEPSAIALVWPTEFYKKEENGEQISMYFKKFIETLLANQIPVTLISSLKKDVPAIKLLFDGYSGLEIIHESRISDIWIRDFGPLFMLDSGKLIPVKTMYKPSYASSNEEENWFAKNNEVGFNLTIPVPVIVEINGDELILDGGNIIHNGFGTGIVTNRVFRDNEHLFEYEIRAIFKEKLGIDELFIIPSEPGDDTGHIDGLVRFLDPNTLAILKYPDSYISNPNYIDKQDYTESVKVTQKIADYLAKQNFNIVRIPCSIPQKGVHKMPSKKSDDNTFENAAGNYMNFLRAGNKVFLPQYNNPQEDEVAYKALNDYFEKLHPEVKVIKVPSDATPLAQYGGIINCITLQLFDEAALKFDPFAQFIPIAYETKEENNMSTMYFTLKEHTEEVNYEFQKAKVVHADLYCKHISGPNIMERFYAYVNPVALDPVEDDPKDFLQQLYLFPSSEIRKLWNIFKWETHQ